MSNASTLSALVTAAQQALARQDRDTASACLDAALDLDPAHLVAHNLRESHALPGHFSDWMCVNAQIAPDDDIFGFFARHPTSRNPLRDYLSDGWRTLIELNQALEAAGQRLSDRRSVLEFAAGHGRFTRHLVRHLPANALTVSDVVPGSVDFLRTQFGVKGFYSEFEPERVTHAERHDLVFVLSLFSHLPEQTWGRWLRRLWAMVDRGGCLVITTHGLKCAERAQVRWDERGYAFFASSESTAIDEMTYGTTYTSDAFVRAAIDREAGEARVHHLPALFWGNQDAWVLQRR